MIMKILKEQVDNFFSPMKAACNVDVYFRATTTPGPNYGISSPYLVI